MVINIVDYTFYSTYRIPVFWQDMGFRKIKLMIFFLIGHIQYTLNVLLFFGTTIFILPFYALWQIWGPAYTSSNYYQNQLCNQVWIRDGIAFESVSYIIYWKRRCGLILVLLLYWLSDSNQIIFLFLGYQQKTLTQAGNVTSCVQGPGGRIYVKPYIATIILIKKLPIWF